MPPVRLLGLVLGACARFRESRAVLRAIGEVLLDDGPLTIHERMGDLPHFNSDP